MNENEESQAPEETPAPDSNNRLSEYVFHKNRGKTIGLDALQAQFKALVKKNRDKKKGGGR